MKPVMSMVAMCVACATTSAVAATADQYPNRPVRFVVPLAAGGGTDIVARLFAQKLSESWNQQVVVDNRPGAGGVIGADIAAKAPPDGYTLVMISSSHTVHPSMYKNLPYDTVKDFAPVSMLVIYPLLVVAHPSVPAKTVKEIIALAKAKPGTVTFASGGSGSAAHLGAELFRSMAGIEMTHIPYKGTGPALTGLIAGEANLGFYSSSSTAQHVKNGRLRAIATTGSRRSAQLPDLPTVAEAGLPGYEASTWAGTVVPAKTPPAIIKRLYDDHMRILRMADVKERIASLEFEPLGTTPEEFGKIINTEVVKWAKVVRESGAKVE